MEETTGVMLATRNATLADLAKILQDQHAAKFDVVAPASKIRANGGLIHLSGTEVAVDDHGVAITEGLYRPTEVADEGFADKLQIPSQYLKRMRASRPDLYDANVNGWLHGRDASEVGGEEIEPGFPGDPRKFLLRCFRGENEGVLRAVLSSGFKIIDNLDVLTAALDGVRASGMNVEFAGCDLTERRMQVKIVAPEVAALAPTLLANYRTPFRPGGAERAGGDAHLRWGLNAAAREGQGYDGNEPVVFAGFVIGNSETGGGAFTITPRLVIQICKNGLKITKDALRSVHLGSKMDEGVIRWSDDTQRKNLELVTAQARDAVATFLDVEYVKGVVARVEEQAATPIANPNDTIKQIGKQLRFSDERINGVLNHFILGGDPTAGGLLNAVTSYAQVVPDADDADDLETQAMRVFELATN